MYVPRTVCAFHKNMIITHFCQCPACLLPLCQQCIGIHQHQHSQIKQPIKAVPIEKQIQEIQNLASQQNGRIEEIYRQTLKNFQKTITLHHNLKRQIQEEQIAILNGISVAYTSIIEEVDKSIKRKQNWFRQFTIQINLARTELINIQNSLNGQKYLRYIIMWNKLKPQQLISEMIKNQNVSWAQPKYQNINIPQFLGKLTASKNLHILQLTGDFGLNRLIRKFQVLKFGQQQPCNSPRQSGILITTPKAKKLSTVKSFDKR